MAEDKKDEGGAAGALIFIILIAVAIYIIFRCSKLVYSYSRSLLLSIWTFLTLSFLTLFTIYIYNNHSEAVLLLALFWLVGTVPILLSTYYIYKIKKNTIDNLIKEEKKIEQQIGNEGNMATKLFTGAGALYAGYKLGHKTEL